MGPASTQVDTDIEHGRTGVISSKTPKNRYTNGPGPGPLLSGRPSSTESKAASSPELLLSGHLGPNLQRRRRKNRNRRFIRRPAHRRRANKKKHVQLKAFKNFSEYTFSPGTVRMIENGGSFVPMPKKVNLTEVDANCKKFARTCTWKWFWHEKEKETG